MAITTIDITATGLSAGEFYDRYDMKTPTWSPWSSIRLMPPVGKERDGHLIDAANNATADAIRAYLDTLTARPAAPAPAPAPKKARCEHFETDNHGICYACGSYVRTGDAGRWM